jgi:hypothetical protein
MRFQLCGWVFSGAVVAAAPLASADAISAAAELGVAHLSLQALEPAAHGDPSATTLTVDLDGRPTVLELWPHDVRGEGFRVVLDHGNGVTEEIAPPPPRTVRGSVAGEPGSIVAGSIIDGAARLVVYTGDETWTIQPASDEGPGVHAVFEGASVLDQGAICGTTDRADRGLDAPMVHHRAGGFAPRGSADFRVAEIAVEADWRLYDDFFNRNETNLLNDLDTVLAGVSAIYERDLALTYELTTVLIRTSNGADPYTTNDPGGLLNQFRDEWNTNQTGVQRDVAHLWTGRNMTGSVIGIAYVGVICGGSSYGVDQIRFSNNFNSRVALFAHELGHNWDASHCNDDSECRIMCAGLGGCDGLGNPVRFAAGPITEMSAHVASRSCVDNIGVDLPVAEVFNGGTLDPALWASTVGFELVQDGSAPSGSRAGRFAAASSSLGTVPVALDVAPGNGVAVRFWARAESGDLPALRSFLARTGESNFRTAVIPAGDAPSYTLFEFYLPASYLGSDALIRFVPLPGEPGWRIDEFTVSEVASSGATASLPFAEDFERGALFLDSWQPSGISVMRDAGAALSGESFAALPPGARAETVAIDASGADDIVLGAFVSAPADSGVGDELVLRFRDSSGVWNEAARFPAAAFPADGYALAEVVLPASAAHGSLAVAIEAATSGAAGEWGLEDLEIGADSRAADCPADIAPPSGVLDLSDINAFTAAFIASDPIADLAAPLGVFDLGDVNAFVASFVAGCP